jgi:hypothetical protein
MRRFFAPMFLGLAACSGLACSSGSDDQSAPAGNLSEGPVAGTTGGTTSIGASGHGSSAGGTGSSTAPTIGLSPGSSMGATPSPSDDSGAPSSEASGGDAAGGAPAEPQNPVQTGLLTSGAWDDNRNFERFLGYRSGLAAANLPGILPIPEEELSTAHAAAAKSLVAHETLDISLVIDTTGSMGDEIAYLQAEFAGISSDIAAAHPNASQRWSLISYRDVGDDFVADPHDFETDTEKFRQALAQEQAGGGGDFPEAPDQAFAAIPQLKWRTGGNTARLVFWVADAPHHVENAPMMAEALRDVQKLGVHVYPIASSGVDELTELSMRTSAMITGGRYLFLTNDSGIGGDHKEPTIPCYFVTSLRNAILRMVDIELSGEYHEPAATEVLRTGGNPQDGACKLGSGETVFAF